MTDPRFTDDPRLRVRPEDEIEIDPVVTRPGREHRRHVGMDCRCRGTAGDRFPDLCRLQ